MNHKQKVIDKCREYSSKELSFGAEYIDENGEGQTVVNADMNRIQPAWADNYHLVDSVKDCKILGHPPGIPQLLQALGYDWAIDGDGYLLKFDGLSWTALATDARIPLNHHTLADIPESDPCWVALTKLLNLD